MSTTSTAPQGGLGNAGRRRVQLRGFPDWPVAAKLAAILLVPAIAALAIGVFRVTDLLDRADSFDTDLSLSQSQAAASDLVAALGREQFVAVGNVTGTSDDLVGTLSRGEAQQATDTAVTRLTALVDATGRPGAVDRRSRALDNALARLDQVRASTSGEVGAQNLRPAQVVRAYDDITGDALALGSTLASSVADDQIRAAAGTTQSLAATNRQVGVEDAFVLALAAQGVGALNAAELRAVDSDRAAAFSGFQQSASEAQQEQYSTVFMGQAGQDRNSRFAEVLRRVSAEGSPSLSPGDWATIAVPSAEATEGVRSQFSADQVALAQSQVSRTRTEAAREGIVLFLLLAVGLAITYLAARSILRPLRQLREDAITIAQVRLPEAIGRIRTAGPDAGVRVQPVGVHSTEEIGQVARAFDAVHTEAVRLAADQEQLRRNVNELFVNLSRRSQALVERQLGLIDRLENDEQDPDQLSQLFRLDHLAARMRRNNDNLMVLAGTDAARPSGRPMPLLDVVRAAVSETEQYERVSVRSTPSLTVAAGTSQDLVHLLAELLDNATVFSPPQTQVGVDVEGDIERGLRIDVTDEGLGISAADLASLNAKLADPPVADAGVPRQMGLFVVAHLARRHGIDVQLRPGTAGGTTASVFVPPSVLTATAGSWDPGRVATTGPVQISRPQRPVAGAPSPRRPLPAPATPAVPAAPPLTAATSGTPAGPDVPSGLPSGSPPVLPPALPGVGDAPAGATPLFARTPVEGIGDAAVNGGSSHAPVRSGSIGNGSANGGSLHRTSAGTATPNGGSGAGQVNGFQIPPSSLDLPAAFDHGSADEETPIFRELSAWFRAPSAMSARPAAPSPASAAAAPVDLTGRHRAGEATVLRIPSSTGSRPGQPAAPAASAAPVAPAAALPATAFATAADAGWAAAAAAQVAAPDEQTSAGLPRRRPMAHLVPGSADAVSAPAPAATVTKRDADAVRGRLANYQRGLQTGRSRLRTGTDDSGDADIDLTREDAGEGASSSPDQRRYAP